MLRRHFIKSSATALAAITVFNKLTWANGNNNTLHNPDEVWALSGNEWHQLTPSGHASFHWKDILVTLASNAGSPGSPSAASSTGVHIQSPSERLSAIRLKWYQKIDPAAKILGDSWERTYGDEAWKNLDPQVKNPWYVLLTDDSGTACFGVKTGCNTLCSWTVGVTGVELTLDTLSGGMGVQLGRRTLHAADIVTTRNLDGENTFATAHRFCRMMCPGPRIPKKPVYGINDWYFAYGNNTDKLIRETTALMAELATDTDNRPFSVIDAGWAVYSPLLPGNSCWNDNFSKPNEKFQDMHILADDIKKLGMRPGLWIRPLCASHDAKPSLLAPTIPGRDDPKSPILDPTIPENIAYIQQYFNSYKEWGIEMVKHDFTTYDITGRWGFSMNDSFTSPGWSFHDSSRTNAEIINHLYSAIRSAAGDHIYIIGCNTVSHLSAGQFELCRIGDDTSGHEWARTRKMGVNTMGFRLIQHNAFYAVDGDCVGLTHDVPWEKNKQWMQLLAESSAPLFISAQPDVLGAEQKAFIKECFTKAAKPQPLGEPLDWQTNPFPSKWKLNGETTTFNWD